MSKTLESAKIVTIYVSIKSKKESYLCKKSILSCIFFKHIQAKCWIPIAFKLDPTAVPLLTHWQKFSLHYVVTSSVPLPKNGTSSGTSRYVGSESGWLYSGEKFSSKYSTFSPLYNGVISHVGSYCRWKVNDFTGVWPWKWTALLATSPLPPTHYSRQRAPPSHNR